MPSAEANHVQLRLCAAGGQWQQQQQQLMDYHYCQHDSSFPLDLIASENETGYFWLSSKLTCVPLYFGPSEKNHHVQKGGTEQHRGRVLASHPAVPSSNLTVAKKSNQRSLFQRIWHSEICSVMLDSGQAPGLCPLSFIFVFSSPKNYKSSFFA